ncbi:acetylxylan esterase [Pelagicoccus sp. SDUM812003]|uniref:acetylxylan esterase n=1 Tax=Pelagicoccus sp. SDUM812003 TaxID=3041267 RepID=UPI00281077D5|nr:acetylxylan esterase [Pelagicoccus sp. SDUM812003]MDQ8203958.1 acetylxylan esterase [Pelagicoccus sp. SDUM812003]
MKRLLISLLCATNTTAVLAQSIQLSLNNPTGVYQIGETIAITAEIADGDSLSDGERIITLRTFQNNQETTTQRTVRLHDEQIPIYETSLDHPGSIMVEASLGDAKDTIGAIVGPEQLQPGLDRPADFETFWEREKAQLATLPLDASLSPIQLPDSQIDLVAYDVEIPTPGPRPARAIFAKPARAEPKSLPIVLNLHAAGVKGDWCRAHLDEATSLARRGSGALAFDLNAHGMLNHEDESYYEALESGPLEAYWTQGIEDRNEYYFRFMYLRLLRSIEFLARQPEWDGKRILVIGESQGGGQALAASGLDSRVTAVVATVPAMCDFGGPLAKRKGGWPQPLDERPDNAQVQNAVAYFDIASILPDSHATLVVEVGLIDQACPSTSIFAAINQAKGEKNILSVPYRAHPWPEQADRERHWDEHVLAKKEAFIDAFLK